MNTNYKELLLKDLCARLPYGVKCKIGDAIKSVNAVFDDGSIWLDDQYDCTIDDIKPYLRPMSSMTEEEQKEFDEFCVIDEEAWNGNGIVGYANQAQIMNKAIDWLNAHYFDYRGLIEKGLAREAPEGMYKTE